MSKIIFLVNFQTKLRVYRKKYFFSSFLATFLPKIAKIVENGKKCQKLKNYGKNRIFDQIPSKMRYISQILNFCHFWLFSAISRGILAGSACRYVIRNRIRPEKSFDVFIVDMHLKMVEFSILALFEASQIEKWP